MNEIESTALKRLQEIQKRLIESTPELRAMKKGRSKFLDQSKESPPTTSNSGRHKKESNHRSSDYDLKVAELKRQINNERDKQEQILLDMQAREARYLKREKEYKKNMIEYEAELSARNNYCGPPEFQFNRNIQKIDKLHNVIINKVSHIQKKTSQILGEQEKDIRRQFNSKIKEVSKEFEGQKRTKLEDTEKIAEKKEIRFHKTLSEMELSIKKIIEKNLILSEENEKIKQILKDQQETRDILFKEIVSLKKENAILMEEIAKHKESGVISSTVSNSGIPKSFSQANLSKDEGPRLESILQRFKKILNSEQNKLKSLQHIYAKENQGKTELEIILKGIIEDHLNESILRTTGSRLIKPRLNKDFSKSEIKLRKNHISDTDREKIFDNLLADPKVIDILSDPTIKNTISIEKSIFSEIYPSSEV